MRYLFDVRQEKEEHVLPFSGFPALSYGELIFFCMLASVGGHGRVSRRLTNRGQDLASTASTLPPEQHVPGLVSGAPGRFTKQRGHT